MLDDDDLAAGERRTAPAPARPGRGRGAPDAVEPPREGTVVDGKYLIEGVLGAGGMGVVVAAMHLGLDERVALKFVRVGAGAGELVERLRREARIAFRIKSEHVARLHDVGTLASGAPYLVMEHLEGQDLARVLSERGRLPIDEAVDHILQACEAMAEAHRLGVVHRDLKPSNLFLTQGSDGKPLIKVLDFGIAKAVGGLGGPADSITSGCAVLGSPLYMSPEQVRGASGVDARSDVWSLGVILQELVTGAPPFASGAASAVCAAIAADPPVRLRARRPDAPEELEGVVLRCLEKDPGERVASVGALAAALAPFASPASARILERIASLASLAGEPRRAAPAATPEVEAPRRDRVDPPATPSAWNAGASAPARPVRYAAALLVVLGIGGAWALTRPGPLPAQVDAAAPRETSTPEPSPPALPPEAPPARPPSLATAEPPVIAVARSGTTRPSPVLRTASAREAATGPVATSAPTAAPAPPPSAPPPDPSDEIERRATSRRR